MHRVIILSFLYLFQNINHYNTLAEARGNLTKIIYKGEKSNDVITTESAMEKLLAIFFSKKSSPIDLSESGSTIRFLIPIAGYIAAKFNLEIIFRGSERLLQRSFEVYDEIFGEFMERYSNKIIIKGFPNESKFNIRGDLSSQFVTGLCFLSLLVKKDFTILFTAPLESKGYIEITKDCFTSFNSEIIIGENFENIIVKGSSALIKKDKYIIEGDYSQGAFFLASAALGANINISNLPLQSSQPDAKIIEILTNMGADISIIKSTKKNLTLKIKPGRLKYIRKDMSDIPDLLPILAVLASIARGISILSNAKRLKDKESDRLFAISTELKKLGANIIMNNDSLIIEGQPFLHGGKVESHNDHRIAMSLAVASLAVNEGEIDLEGYSAVQKSYPDFWKVFLNELTDF
jgi:3-phosphoshikimate 1-carboxyvinyltransferase